MKNYSAIFKERKLDLLDKFKHVYDKNLQTEITNQLEKRNKKGLEFAAHAYNKYQSIKSKISAAKEPATQEEFDLAMKALDKLEAEFNAWLQEYYYKLYPVYKPKKYGV